MAHPLFARLDRQFELIRNELGNVTEADRRLLRAAPPRSAQQGRSRALSRD